MTFLNSCTRRTLAPLVLAALVVAPLTALAAQAPRPNILLIVLDDVGYSDIGSYGSEIATPTFNELAGQGLRYSNFHATPTCSPSRAALLTGREPHQVGMGLVTEYDLGPQMPAFRARITPKAATIAQVLQKEGYGTYAVGKWHLAPPLQQNAIGPFDHWPSGKGFDHFYGFLAGSTDQFHPGLMRDHSIIDVSYPEGEVLTTDLIDNAVSYITDHISHGPDKPFMMYLSLPGMHAPHQASDAYLEKYRGKYALGWDAVREQRFQKQKASGLMPADAKLPDFNRGLTHWDDLGEDAQQVYARFQEVYAGMLEQTDFEVGRLLDALEVLGQRDNTLVMLVSDNGASNGGFWHGSSNMSTWYNEVRETMEDNQAVLDNIGRSGSGPNYPRGWAQASNTPFPYYKAQPYAGGVNVPMLISWPDGIAARGETRHQYHYISDIVPTLSELVGFEMPNTLNGIEQLPVEGVSMAYSFAEANEPSHRNSQFYRMGDHRGIYQDGWAAVAMHRPGTPLKRDQWALFNLENDVTQSTDLAKKNPGKLTELQAFWQQEALRLGADKMLEPLLKANGGKRPGTQARPAYTYYPNTSNLPEKSTPRVMGRNFSVTVPVHEVASDSAGVLVAHGNGQSGYVLYMQDGLLVAEYNYLGTVASSGKRYKVVSERAVPAGSSTLGFKLQKSKWGKGATLTLLIDGEEAGDTKLKAILTKRISHEGLDVGRDRYNAVGKGYSAPFPFTARIEVVAYTVED